MTPIRQIAYLGPEGTFSGMMARKRFGKTHRLVAIAGIYEVFEYVRKHRDALGIVPIENSSGGSIYETIDCLVEPRKPLYIREELSLNVRLALLGRRGYKILRLYSHFAPMQHCDEWIRKELPRVERHETVSTAQAAEIAGRDEHGAALGTKGAAAKYKLDVLQFPVYSELPNVTQFVCIGHDREPFPNARKTSLLVTLHNHAGALCEYLEIFRDHSVNLTRLLSRPIIGKPKSYLFFIDVDGTPATKRVASALSLAKKTAESMRIIGVYPVRRPYSS